MYFRTRIFTMSILTVSAVLAVVISLSWSRIMKVELEHLDSRLCMEAKRMMPKKDANYPLVDMSIVNVSSLKGRKLTDDLVDKLRISSPHQLILSVESREHGILTKSQGVDIEQIISRFSSANANQLESTEMSRSNLACQFVSFEHEQNQWRASFYRVPDAHSFIAVELAATTTELKSTLRSALIVVIPFSLLISILGAWFIAINTIRPINRLQKSMDSVTNKDLSHRLPEHREDKEFKDLIDAYNTMLNRLEESFQQISRFTSDAAHELKTPLTILRGKLEQAVICEDSSQVDLNAILDEVGHLAAITRKLLLLSQADSGSMALHLESINLTDVLDEMTADLELLSSELVLHCAIERGLTIEGDSVLLGQLLNNLLTNALRYSLHDKGVTIQATENQTSIDVLISNYSLPLSNEVRAKLFERFYRGELEHTQGISGSGLGLSLAREIARAHGGDLTLEHSPKDVFVVRLVLPIVK